MKKCKLDEYMEMLWNSTSDPGIVFSDKTYQSLEYQKVVAPFLAELAEFEQYLVPFWASYKQVYEEMYRTVTRCEYGTGSRYLPLGFYHPDPTAEVVVSNAERGRIIKQMTKNTKPDYIYGFDSEGQLVVAEQLPNESGIGYKEVVLRCGELTTCLRFNDPPDGRYSRLCFAMQCFYCDKQLIKIRKTTIYHLKKLMDMELLEFSYTASGVKDVIRSQIHVPVPISDRFQSPLFGLCSKYPRVSREVLRFNYDPHEKLAGFRVIWSNGKVI